MKPHYAAANLAEPHHNGCRLGLPENPQPVCSLQLGRNRSKGGFVFCRSAGLSNTSRLVHKLEARRRSSPCPAESFSSATFAAPCSFWKRTWSTSGKDGHATMGFRVAGATRASAAQFPQANTSCDWQRKSGRRNGQRKLAKASILS